MENDPSQIMNLSGSWRIRKAAEDAETVYISEKFGVRSLHIGSDTVQSAMRISAPNDLELSYTRSMMGFLLFNEKPQTVLMIGLGGGSLAKFCHRHLPRTRLTVVEVDPDVIALRGEASTANHILDEALARESGLIVAGGSGGH